MKRVAVIHRGKQVIEISYHMKARKSAEADASTEEDSESQLLQMKSLVKMLEAAELDTLVR